MKTSDRFFDWWDRKTPKLRVGYFALALFLLWLSGGIVEDVIATARDLGWLRHTR